MYSSEKKCNRLARLFEHVVLFEFSCDRAPTRSQRAILRGVHVQ